MRDIFDRSMDLQDLGAGLYSAYAAPEYAGAGAMFGGWTAALAIRAVLAAAASDKRILSLTIHYLQRLPPDVALRVRTLCLKEGRTLSQWRCDIVLEEAGALLATAQLCMGARIETERFQDVAMPTVIGPDTLAPAQLPFACFENMDIRFEHGNIWFTNEGTGSLVWARFGSDVVLDASRLAYLADISPPRSYFVMREARPTPTVTMTVNIYATLAELESTTGQFILCDLRGTRMEEGYSGATGRIWTRDGRLLATTEQLQWSPP